MHFIPTSSNWLNQVERWFGERHSKRWRALLPAWRNWRRQLRNFWLAGIESRGPCLDGDGGKHMAKVQRARQKLEAIKPGWSWAENKKTRKISLSNY